MLKGALYILLALLIDGFQVLIEVAFTMIGAVSGTIGAAAAAYTGCMSLTGSTAAANACAFVGGFFGSFANPAAAAIALPFGIMLGFIIGVVVSATLGTALVFALTTEGMFYPSYVVPAYLGEVIPGLDLLPAWTVMTVLSVLRKKAESGDGTLLSKAAGVATAAASAAKGDVEGATKMAQQTLRQPAQAVANTATEDTQKKSRAAAFTDVRPNPTMRAANDDQERKAA